MIVYNNPYDSRDMPNVELSYEACQWYVHDTLALSGWNATDSRAMKKQEGATLELRRGKKLLVNRRLAIVDQWVESGSQSRTAGSMHES